VFYLRSQSEDPCEDGSRDICAGRKIILTARAVSYEVDIDVKSGSSSTGRAGDLFDAPGLAMQGPQWNARHRRSAYCLQRETTMTVQGCDSFQVHPYIRRGGYF